MIDPPGLFMWINKVVLGASEHFTTHHRLVEGEINKITLLLLIIKNSCVLSKLNN